MANAVEHILFKSDVNSTVELIERPFMAASTFIRNNETIIGYSATIGKGNITRSHYLLSNATYHEEIDQSDVVILLPTELPQHQDVRVLFVIYPDSRLLDASAASGNFSSSIYARNREDVWLPTDESCAGNGGMAQVKVSSEQAVTPAKPLTILFRSKTKLNFSTIAKLRCVFWEGRANNGRGGWSTEGCWINGILDDLVICRCNHLSTFTLLVSLAESNLRDTVHGTVLTIFTIIGALLSIAGLMLIVVVFITVRSWRKPLGHRIVFQLSIALILLLLTFLVGVNNVSNRLACKLAGVALHYFLFASFAWMTVEAYVQYLFLVKIFDTYVPHLLLKASLIAWGTPIVPILIVLIVDSDLYNGTAGYCWIDKRAFYPAVVAPLATMLSVNFTVFILILRSFIVTGRSVMRSSLVTTRRSAQKAFAAILNILLLGLTWTFGFLAIGLASSVVFSYLFCFTTVLQGFFIFLFYAARDPSLKVQLSKWFGHVVKSRSNELRSPGSTVSTQSFSFFSGVKHP